MPFMNVKAVSQGVKKITKKENTGIPINVKSINNQQIHHGNFYKIELDDQVTLCLNANMPINKGAEYKKTRDISLNGWANILWVKAYIYAVNNKNDDIARAAAQIVAWQRGVWPEVPTYDDANQEYMHEVYRNTELYKAFYQGLSKFRYKSSTLDQEAYKQLVNILNTEIPSGATFGVWTDVKNPGNQQVIAFGDIKQPETQQKETCKLKRINRLSSCYGTYGTYGYAFETTEGDCLPGFNKMKNNVYSLLGKKELDVGTYCRMYCTKQFQETLPANIATVINVGRYIVWPNNNINNNRYKANANLSEYPMALAIEKECYLSADLDKLTQDYTTVLYNYNRYISSIRDIYNNYANHSRTCSWYQSDYNTKNSDATKYCATVGPDPGAHNEPYTCCSAPAPKDKKGNIIGPCPTTKCDHWVDNPGRAEWRARNNECNRLRGKANDAANKLNSCNNIQNYVNAVANVVNDFNNCVSYNASFNLDFSAPGINASYDDDEYGTTMQLKESKIVRSCSGCYSSIGRLYVDKNNVEINLATNGSLKNKTIAIGNRQIIASSLKYYDLYDGYYYYVNKNNNKSVSSKSGLTNYSIIGFSNMPVSYKATPRRTYNLRINVPMLTGMASDFSSMAASNNYVCNYNVTKTTSSSCICPEGTRHAGESLDCVSKDNSGTCLDNQEQYCNSMFSLPHDCTTNTSLTCPNDSSMDLTSCVNAGKTYSWCVTNICNKYKDPTPNSPRVQRWMCPSGTNAGMDLSSCVMPMIAKGYNETDAYAYCRDITCPYNGIKIIYRLIDLSNPFPSKDADSVVTQRDLSKGMFNDTLKGRYPGSNWNSTKVVKNRILLNRSVDGDKVYNQKPLYEFTLNSSNIKAIRNYNKSQRDSYADFNLNCLKDNTACVSSFIRSSISGITGGACRNVTINSFYTCNK